MHSGLSIFIFDLLKCVFLYRESGNICRFGAESFAGLDRQFLPVRRGKDQLSLFLHGQVQAIEVGLSKTALSYL